MIYIENCFIEELFRFVRNQSYKLRLCLWVCGQWCKLYTAEYIIIILSVTPHGLADKQHTICNLLRFRKCAEPQ